MGKRGPKPGTPKPPNSGRQKGTPNKKNAELQSAVAAAGITPLDYMLGVLRDEAATAEHKRWAAAAAAPYVHPRLQSTTTALTGEGGGPVVVRLPAVEPDAETWRKKHGPQG